MSSPSFCWLCSKPLKRREDGSVIFSVVRYGPEAHRVHHACGESHNDAHRDNHYAKRAGTCIINRALRVGPDQDGDEIE